MADLEVAVEIVRRLAALVAEHGLAELTVEEGGLVVVVKGASEAVVAPAVPIAIPAHPHVLPPAQTPAYSQSPAAPQRPSAASAASTTAVALQSPMVGVFYRSASPDDPPFVAVGDVVKAGQAIGLIEAMKVYSEVPAEIAGRIIDIPAQTGKLVQQGQTLILVEPV